MKDLHSHILPLVDDGSKSLDDSKLMIDNAKENNVSDIVLTPHYISGSRYSKTYKENEKAFQEIKEYAIEKGVNIYLGNEVFFDNDMLKKYNEELITTINNSKYLLIELPMNSRINDVKSEFYELINNGITPVLAHPERYTPYYKDLDFFKELKKIGVLMQLNYVSVLGIYGSKAKKMAKLLLKNNLISFVGSDIHHSNEEKYNLVLKSIKKIDKYIGKEERIKITETNFDLLINNKNID